MYYNSVSGDAQKMVLSNCKAHRRSYVSIERRRGGESGALPAQENDLPHH